MKLRSTEGEPLRVGIIGAGAFAVACHVPGLQAHSRATIAAICGRNFERTRAIAAQFDIPAVYTDYRELCARADIDAVTIVTPNAAHAEQAVAAFRHGKHVLCEKPLGRSISEAEMMLDAAIISAKVHQVAFTFRYLWGVRELRRRVLAGDIGVPYLVRVQYDGWWGLSPNFRAGWREQQALAGGGMLHDVGSHLFDLARFLFGPIETVTGFLHWIPRKRFDSTNGNLVTVDTDDIAAAWFRHTSGVRGQWFASRATPSSVENGWLEITGPEGALRAALSRGTRDNLEVSRPTRTLWEPLPLPVPAGDGTPHALTRMMSSFVEACIKGHSNSEVDATFVDGVAAQRGVHAVMQANEQLVWVPLSDKSVGEGSPQEPASNMTALKV